MKIRAHKCLFRALGTIVSRKFRHWPISHKVRGNTGRMYWNISGIFCTKISPKKSGATCTPIHDGTYGYKIFRGILLLLLSMLFLTIDRVTYCFFTQVASLFHHMHHIMVPSFVCDCE